MPSAAEKFEEWWNNAPEDFKLRKIDAKGGYFHAWNARGKADKEAIRHHVNGIGPIREQFVTAIGRLDAK